MEMDEPSAAAITERHRPRTFAQIIGQAECIDWLRQQVVWAREDYRIGGRHSLFRGPSGTGKTSLAEIYAKALHCEEVGAAGEPCLKCLSCRRYESLRVHDNLVRIDAAAMSASEIKAELNEFRGSSLEANGWLVVIVDQAHLLAAESVHAIHSRIERSPVKTTYVFCTTTPDDVPERTRLCLRTWETRPLCMGDRMALLRRVCDEEGWEVEEGALETLARFAGGQPRRLLNQLEAAMVSDIVTSEAVLRNSQSVDRKLVFSYLRQLLAREGLGKQFEVFSDWAAEPATKQRCVLESLDELFALKFFTRSPIDGAYADEALEILKAFTVRADERGRGARTMFEAALTLWGEPFHSSEAGFRRRVSEFDGLMNGLIQEDEASGQMRVRPRRSLQVAASGNSEDEGAGVGSLASGPAPSGEEYLNFRQLRSMWDAGSFLVQNYGMYLNTELTVRYGALGIKDGNDAARFMTDLLRELGMRIDRYCKTKESPEPFQWIYVHERVDGEMQTTLIASVADRAGDLRQWIVNEFLRDRPRAARERAVEWHRTEHRDDQCVKRHFALLRLISRGLDPAYQDSVLSGPVPDAPPRPVLDILKIGGARPCGARFTKRRIGVSVGVNEGVRVKVARDLPALSVFDRREFQFLDTSWEQDEFVYRRDTVSERVRAEEQIESQFGATETELALKHQELKALERRWAEALRSRIQRRPGLK